MIFSEYFLLFAIPGLLLGLYAQFRLTSTYRKYIRVGVQSGVTGAQAAREILDQAGLHQMPVNEVRGHLTDHYDPMKRALFLSSENFHGRSLVPLTQFASMAWMGILVFGMIFQLAAFSKLLWIAVAIFAVITFFQVITLPVEFDASRRAKEQLLRLGIIREGESGAVSRVLNAAALTYVAAMVTAVMQLLHLLLLARNRA
jgi:Zn-dependent membrane protease YugP